MPPPARMVADDIRRSQRLATIMAIGTANPPTFYDQSTFPDFYFRVTNSEDKTELKQKFQRLCNDSMIKKRYRHLTEDILKKYPNWCEYKAPSLDASQDEMVVEVPKLGQEASENAIQEWGQPKSKITHLIFCTSCGVDMPGADYQLTNLLGLNPSVKRFMLYNSGCYAGGTGLRLAKDLAENSKGARILVVNCEITSAFFHGPSDTELDILVTMSLFGDGASATIVGSNPIHGVEKPLFEIVSATQMLIPDSGDAVAGHLRESGLMVHLKKDVPGLISKNIEKILVDSFQPLGVSDWNSIFWIAHPGGRAVLDRIEKELGLETKRLDVSRHVLSEFGNMSSATVVFVLDEMRKRSVREGLMTTGEGLEWGVLFGFGPGLTVQTLVLHSISTQAVGSTILNS